MALTPTNALVSLAISGGGPSPLANGAVTNVPAGASLVFSLQSAALVQTWSLFFQDLDNQQLNQTFTWNAGQQNNIALQLGPQTRRLLYTSTVSDGASSVASVAGEVVSSTSATGGGGTTTAASFTPPAINGTVTLAVVDATVLAKFQTATIAGNSGPLNYRVDNIVSNSATFRNIDPLNTVGGTVASGAKVAFGGAGAQLAAQSIASGQVWSLDPTTQQLTPKGHRPVINLASIPGFATASTNLETAIENAVALAATGGANAGLTIYCPAGVYGSSRPIFVSNAQGVEFDGPHIAGLNDVRGFAANTLGNWDGPAFVIGNDQPDPAFVPFAVGTTTTTTSYTQPAYLGTVVVTVASATGATIGGYARIGTQNYTITAIAGLSITVENTDPINSTSGTIASGSAVIFGVEFGITLGFPPVINTVDVISINLSSTVSCSLDGLPSFGIDLSYDQQGHWSAGQTYVIAACNGCQSAATQGSTFTQAFTLRHGDTFNGINSLRAYLTTTNGLFVAQSATVLPTTGKVLISVVYTGAALQIWQAGTMVASVAATGNIVQRHWERFFLGAENLAWLGGSDTRAGGSFSALTGALLGSTRVSLGGLYVATPNAKTPVFPMAVDTTSVITLRGQATYTTAILIDFSPGNRSSIICGRPNWIVAQKNTIRYPYRLTASTQWLSMRGRITAYMPYFKMRNMSISSYSEGLVTQACVYTDFENVYCQGFERGMTLDGFSYFSRVTAGENNTPVTTGGALGLVYDSWSTAMLSESCSGYGIKANGGMWALIMSGGNVYSPYIDSNGDGALAVVGGGDRTFVGHDIHAYNEGGATSVALVWLQDCKAARLGGLFGTVGGTVPDAILVDGGGDLDIGPVEFTSGSPALAFSAGAPVRPPRVSGTVLGEPWVDTAYPGLIQGLHGGGISVIPTSGTTMTVTDPQFFGGYTLKFTGALTANCTLTLPLAAVDGWHVQILNTTTGGFSLLLSSLTIAPNTSLRVTSRGGAWVSDT